ncbi:hypothetical protein V8C44DRAFT_250550 [Trichoderma aethiopicum]
MHCIDLLLQPCSAGRANQRRQQEYMASQGTRLSKGCVRGRSNSNGDDFVLLCGVSEPPILTAPCRGPLPSELKQLLIGFSKCAQYAFSRQSSDNDRIVQACDWGGASSCSSRVIQHKQHMVRQSSPAIAQVRNGTSLTAVQVLVAGGQPDLESQRPQWSRLLYPCE